MLLTFIFSLIPRGPSCGRKLVIKYNCTALKLAGSFKQVFLLYLFTINNFVKCKLVRRSNNKIAVLFLVNVFFYVIILHNEIQRMSLDGKFNLNYKLAWVLFTWFYIIFLVVVP